MLFTGAAKGPGDWAAAWPAMAKLVNRPEIRSERLCKVPSCRADQINDPLLPFRI